jgi:phosphatidylserine/phosphatidylglycerophosphate/cardiolipin synthase-like enzyme
MHHKFVVIDFNKPTARVYTGSYNFSAAADTKNAENLFLIRDQRVATSYMIEAITMFDHYEFRDAEAKASNGNEPLQLQKPPVNGSNVKPWWDKFWTNPWLEHDRELFGT